MYSIVLLEKAQDLNLERFFYTSPFLVLRKLGWETQPIWPLIFYL